LETDKPLLKGNQTSQLTSDDVEVRANTFVTTAPSQSQRESSPKFKVRYLDHFSSWYKAESRVAWIRRGIESLRRRADQKNFSKTHPSENANKSQVEQNTQFFSVLSVLKHSTLWNPSGEGKFTNCVRIGARILKVPDMNFLMIYKSFIVIALTISS